jgi:hypothetical protein
MTNKWPTPHEKSDLLTSRVAKKRDNSTYSAHQPHPVHGRVANAHGEMVDVESLKGLANHAANDGRTDGTIDARVGGFNSHKHNLRAPPIAAGMQHVTNDVLRTGGGNDRSVVESGSTLDLQDYLKNPAPKFPKVQAAFGQRSRTAECADPAHMGRAPGENMRRGQNRHDDDLGKALLMGAVRSGSSVINPAGLPQQTKWQTSVPAHTRGTPKGR